MEKKLFTECQSAFILKDSRVAQLTSGTHNIYKGFDCKRPCGIKG